MIALGFVPVVKEISDGLVPLSVVVRSDSESPIAGVWCEATAGPVAPQDLAKMASPLEPGLYAADQNPFAGTPLVVNIPTSDKTCYAVFCSWKRYYQFRALLVVVIYKDGRHHTVVADTPDMRECKTLLVSVP